MTKKLLLLLLFNLMLITGCVAQENPVYIVRVVADGLERAYQISEPVTVDKFLQEIEEIEINQLDRINPPLWTQIFDGILITIVRVTEEEECQTVEIPYKRETLLVEGLAPGEERVGQVGGNGLEQICYRITIEEGRQTERVEISRVVTSPAKNEVVYVGPTGELEPIPINGTLVYINNRNAWMIRGSSTAKRPLTITGDLDPRIFSLSDNGQQLLFARSTESAESVGNQLWMIPDVSNQNPEFLQLTPQDILYADWVPGVEHTISYSTFEPRETAPGWQAVNDLFQMRIDPQTGNHIDITKILEQPNGGLYGWWGTQFKWSPDGSRLAWIQADSIGLVDLEGKKLEPPLLEYPVLQTVGDWSWRTTVSWSNDSNLIITTVHGPPLGNESPENSPIFDIAMVDANAAYKATLVEKAGIWSTPRFSPEVAQNSSQFPKGYIAYLQARDWNESRRGEYDLVVTDRDGSNARIIFPEEGQQGLSAQQFAQDFAWSPDGQQIAFIYLGNLWVINVESGIANQLTQDNGASKPIWKR